MINQAECWISCKMHFKDLLPPAGTSNSISSNNVVSLGLFIYAWMKIKYYDIKYKLKDIFNVETS